MATTKRRTGWWFLIVLAILIAGVGVALKSGKLDGLLHREATASPAAAAGNEPAEGKPARKAVPVEVAGVTVRPIQRTVQIVGSFEGYDEVTVTAEVSGRVVAIFKDVADVVKPGDVLLKIDPLDYQLALEETKRALELDAARIGLPVPPDADFVPEKILAVLRSFPLDRLPTVMRAKEQEENARRRYERAQQLRSTNNNIITEEAFEQQQTEYEVARQNREQSEMDAQAVVAGIKHRVVLLQIAMEKLQDTSVVVPQPTRRERMPASIEYSVAERKVTEGEMLKDSPGLSTATFKLVMDEVLKLVGNVPERYVGQVKPGQPVKIRVDAYPGRVFDGAVQRITPMVDRVNRTFQVEVHVPNPKRELRSGGYAKGDIETYVDPNAWTVPLESLVTFVGSTKVYVVRDGEAVAVPVFTGVEGRDARTGQRWVEIVEPDTKRLSLQSQLITTGHNQLADGVPVTIRTAESKKAESEKLEANNETNADQKSS